MATDSVLIGIGSLTLTLDPCFEHPNVWRSQFADLQMTSPARCCASGPNQFVAPTAVRASGSVKAPAYNALPTIAPSTQRREGPQVVQPADAPAHNHRPIRRAVHRTKQIEIRPREHAVTLDVGHDRARAAVRVETGQHVEQFAAVFGAATRRQRRTAEAPPAPDGSPSLPTASF